MANKKVEKDVEIIEEVTEEVIEDGEVMAIDVVKKPNLFTRAVDGVKNIPNMTVGECAKKVVLPVAAGIGIIATAATVLANRSKDSEDIIDCDPSSYADEMEEVTYTETTEGN